MQRVMLCAALALTASAVAAQTPEVARMKLELRPFVGASIPTGTQRDLFKDAATFGAQGAVEVRPNFHIVSSFGWTPAQTKYEVLEDNVNVFQYDVGIEYGMVRALSARWQLKPFVGLGAGGRTYAYASDELTNRTCLSGYGALGTEFQFGRTAFRLEGRNNVFCYKAPVAGVDSKTRNDVGLALGVAYHFR